MGNMVQHLGNTTSVTSMHHLRDLWNSPRGTVLRIQALAVVAILITFFLAAFGSCRRWSNRWIVQKGFFAAHVLSLSLGTYSIGLMQSSSVKSEMYPIWTVSLFTLFGCIDPVTGYNGFDYKGPLSKMVFGIFLNCGYVLLMSISTISSVVGNTAIGGLAAITFIKGFHRSLALMQQSRMRNMVQTMDEDPEGEYVLEKYHDTHLFPADMIVDFGTDINERGGLCLDLIEELLNINKYEWLQPCYDVCFAMFLSHRLQRHFLGLSSHVTRPQKLKNIDCNWALKLIEIELALLFDVFFTGNPFLHYYQAKTASLWALASFIGICFVGVAAAIPGTLSSRHIASGPGGCINVVGTTTADLVITFVILVSLALLQLMHLIRCWTSNWARVAIACAYARNHAYGKDGVFMEKETPYWLRRWMGLKAFVATSSNWFDKYLWQEKIGQYSLLPEGRLTAKKEGVWSSRTENKLLSSLTSMVGYFYQKCARLVKVLGLDYIGEVLWDLLGSDTNKRTTVRLDDDVKGYVIDFLHQIKTNRVDTNWLSFGKKHPMSIDRPFRDDGARIPLPQQWNSHAYKYTECIMEWHIATWYCELVEQELEKQDALSKAEEHIGCRETATSYLKKAAAAIAGYIKKEAGGGGGRGGRGEREENRNRRVANALSKYCTYLVVSAPELLPGPAMATKRAYDDFAKSARIALDKQKNTFLGALSDPKIWKDLPSCSLRDTIVTQYHKAPYFWDGVGLAKRLLGDDPPLVEGMSSTIVSRRDPWETLALMWVRMLVYAAPYGNVEAHMRHLQRGGEFITHLWALLYHLDIREWKEWKSTSTTKFPKDPQNIITIDDAERILAEDDQAVIAFLDSLSGSYCNDELAAASKLEDGLRFYQTTSVYVAKLFNIDPAAKRPCLVLLKKQKFTIYDGPFRARRIADFLSVNKKQRRGGQTDKDETDEQSEDEIEMEIPQQS